MEYANQAQGRGLSYPATTGYADKMPEPPESPSRIRDGITNAEQYLSELHDAITAVENRFDTVLRPVGPTNAAQGSATPQSVASHVTGRLTILNEGFQQAISRLREIANRAEV